MNPLVIGPSRSIHYLRARSYCNILIACIVLNTTAKSGNHFARNRISTIAKYMHYDYELSDGWKYVNWEEWETWSREAHVSQYVHMQRRNSGCNVRPSRGISAHVIRWGTLCVNWWQNDKTHAHKIRMHIRTGNVIDIDTIISSTSWKLQSCALWETSFLYLLQHLILYNALSSNGPFAEYIAL